MCYKSSLKVLIQFPEGNSWALTYYTGDGWLDEVHLCQVLVHRNRYFLGSDMEAAILQEQRRRFHQPMLRFTRWRQFALTYRENIQKLTAHYNRLHTIFYGYGTV